MSRTNFDPAVFGKRNESCGKDGHNPGSYEAKVEAAMRHMRVKRYEAIRFGETNVENIPEMVSQVTKGAKAVEDREVTFLNKTYESADQKRASCVIIFTQEVAQHLLNDSDKHIYLSSGNGVQFCRARLAGTWGSFGGWILLPNTRRTAMEARLLTEQFAHFLRTKKSQPDNTIQAEIRIKRVRGDGAENYDDNRALALQVGLLGELDKYQGWASEWLTSLGGTIVQGTETFRKAMAGEAQWGSWSTENAGRTLVAHNVLARKLRGDTDADKTAAAREKIEQIMVEENWTGPFTGKRELKEILAEVQWMRNATGSTGRVKMLMKTVEEAKKLKDQSVAMEAALGGGQVSIEWEGEQSRGSGGYHRIGEDRGTLDRRQQGWQSVWGARPQPRGDMMRQEGRGRGNMGMDGVAGFDQATAVICNSVEYKRMMAEVAKLVLAEKEAAEVSEHQDTQNKIVDLASDMGEMEDRLANTLAGLEDKITKWDQEFDQENMQRENDSLQEDLDGAWKEAEWWKSEHDKIKAGQSLEILKIQNDKDNIEAWAGTLFARNGVLEAEMKSMTQALQGMKEQGGDEALRSELVALKLQMAELEKVKTEALAAAAENERRMQAFGEESRGKWIEVDEEKQKMAVAWAVIETREDNERQERIMTRERLRVKQEEVAALDKENKKLKVQKSAALAEVERVKWEAATNDGEVTKLRNSLEMVKKERDEAQKQQLEQMMKLDRMREEYANVEQEKGEFQRSYEDRKEREEKALRQKAELQSRVEKLEQRAKGRGKKRGAPATENNEDGMPAAAAEAEGLQVQSQIQSQSQQQIAGKAGKAGEKQTGEGDDSNQKTPEAKLPEKKTPATMEQKAWQRKLDDEGQQDSAHGQNIQKFFHKQEAGKSGSEDEMGSVLNTDGGKKRGKGDQMTQKSGFTPEKKMMKEQSPPLLQLGDPQQNMDEDMDEGEGEERLKEELLKQFDAGAVTRGWGEAEDWSAQDVAGKPMTQIAAKMAQDMANQAGLSEEAKARVLAKAEQIAAKTHNEPSGSLQRE